MKRIAQRFRPENGCSWASSAGFRLLMGLALCLVAPAQAQVLSIGDDGTWTALCTAAQNQKATLSASVSPTTSRQNPHIPEVYRATFYAAAARYELSPDLLEALAWQESRFNARARSPKGAMGLMQLMPATARSLGVDPADPEQNIFGGAAYLRYMLNAFDGQIDLALAAYNAGQGAVNRYGGIPPYKETRTYVSRNLDHLAQLSDVSNAPVSQSSVDARASSKPSSFEPGYIETCR